LVINKQEILQDGDQVIELKNNGETQIAINGVNLINQQTKDFVNKETTNCYGKTLYPQQICQVYMHVYPGEAGINSLKFETNVGLYDFKININTSQNGVFESDTKILTSLKEKTISVYNRGSVPITINAINLDEKDTTLKITDRTCLNKEIPSNEYCQINVTPSIGVSKLHVLSFATTNQYLTQQQVNLAEETILHSDDLITDINTISTEGETVLHVTNKGKYEFTFDNIALQVGVLCTAPANVPSV
jgi:hypothetical protein